MAGGSLLVLAEAWAASGDAHIAAELQAALIKATAAGKESREAREAALKAFKAVQQRLAAAGSDDCVVQELAAVGRACLAALAALAPATQPAQLAGWRYNFARRLVSCKSYTVAQAEAWELFQQLSREQQATAACGRATSGTPSPAQTEAANLMVGTVLTLVLSCVEGKLLGNADAVHGMLTAAECLPRWLSQLGAEEAARHGEAAYKYLYKAGVTLLERRAWKQLAGVCAGLLAAAGSDATAQRRALAAAAKLTAHMPEEHGAAALAAVAARAGSMGAGELSSDTATSLLDMLCAAAQRAACPAAARELQRAVLSCAASEARTLQTAPLVLPALAVQLPADVQPEWLGPVAATVQLVSDSLQRLGTQLEVGAPPLPLGEAQRHLAVLQAACLPANALRRALAGQLAASGKAAAAAVAPAGVCGVLGGAAAVGLAAAALELLAGAVGVGSRLAPAHGQAGTGSSSSSTGAASSLAGHGHAAAVGLVTAARLRAAAASSGIEGCGTEPGTLQAAYSLLGWDLQRYGSGSADLPPAACAVDPQELSWLASALFNVGVDLHASQCYAAAVPPLQAAVAAAAVGLRVLAEGDVPAQEEAPRVADFCRKCVALSDAQHRAGDAVGALGSLGHSLALLLQLGFVEAAAGQPLVLAFVRLQSELLQDQPDSADSAASIAPPQPSRRGRGTASKKASAAMAAAAAAADPSVPGTGGSADVMLVSLLQQHATDLPTGSIAAVMEQEMLCWAAGGERGSSAGAGGSSVGRLVGRLLQEVFPAAQKPVEHAGALLALHQAGLPAADGQGGTVLLERAAAALKKAPGAEAAGLLARTHCLMALGSGRQLARQALLEQQQERQLSHAAASTSAAGSKEQDASALGQLADGTSASDPAWQRVAQQARQAVGSLRAAGGRIGGAGSGCGQAGFEELSWLLGLHGMEAAAQQLHKLLQQSTTPAGAVLVSLLFPAGAAASATELQQQAEAAAAEASRSSAGVAMQRAALHREAAEASAAAGDMVPALYHAAEAHRLLAVLFHGGEDGTAALAAAQGSSSPVPGAWWRLVAAYLGSLLQLGQLFEAAGQADEALHSLREGQRLAVAAGSAAAVAAFAVRLADIHCKQGELAAAEQAASAAEQQLASMAGSKSLAASYCQAATQLVRAQIGVAAANGSPGRAVWQACLAAVAACEELAAAAAAAGSGTGNAAAAGGWCGALHAAARLTAAEAAWKRDDAAAALEHASAAVAATNEDEASPCSALRYQRAAALLFLGQHGAAEAAAEQHISVWGLGAAAASPAGTAATKGCARKAPARQPAGRGRSRAAVAAADGDRDDGVAARQSAAASAFQQQQHVQQLWQALELSRGLLAVHRSAAAQLAAECGRLGYLHLAAWLLHSSLGPAMRLQYQLVLYSRRQQLAQRQRRGAAVGSGAVDLPSQLLELERLAAVLEPGLDWQAVLQLAGGSASSDAQPATAPAARGRRAASAKAASTAAAAPDPAAALAALDQQAQQQLQAWQAALPSATATCSISVLPGSRCGSILISRLAPAGSGAVDQPPLPPLLVAVPVQQLSASLSQHPIRALRMDDDAADDACGASVSSVQSVLDEMAAVLAESGRSMREMSTETKEQQREWWRARLSLDDRLAALTKHVDSSWLGPWRGLLLGPPLGREAGGQVAAQRLLELLAETGQPASQQQEGVVRHAAAVLAQHAGSMSVGELRQAAHQLCHAAGLACTQEHQHQLESLLLLAAARQDAGGSGAAAPAVQEADAEMLDATRTGPSAAAGAAAGGGGAKAKRAGKSVKFADEPSSSSEAAEQPAEQQHAGVTAPAAAGAQPAAASSSRAGRGRRAASARGSARGSAAAAAAPEEEEAAPSSSAAGGGGGDASPVATLSAVGGSRSAAAAAAEEEPPGTVTRGALCQVFDELSLEEAAAPGTAAAAAAAAAPASASARGGGTTIARAGKHRSRLRMLQAGTPGPATARSSHAAARAAAGAGAATAPRPARELPLTAAKTAPPPGPRPGSSGGDEKEPAAAAAGPVLLVLDGGMQALPWESTPGLLRQRVYRMPSLACAAASAQRASTSVDLSSTFYALNPSGDLAATQATFQDWFRGMKGWEGKAGSAPTAAELAAALQRHSFFLYCGHGGGEQYISVTKLRSLERCSAALLMGCSSGRLRAQQHYEPTGAVLAYLLAGCPTAVANLWDVTDRDIDRFSQAALTSWISGNGSSSCEAGGGSSSSSSSKAGDGGSRGDASGAQGGADMSVAVGASRAVCKLQHLVGAAPVCYGLPSRVFLS